MVRLEIDLSDLFAILVIFVDRVCCPYEKLVRDIQITKRFFFYKQIERIVLWIIKCDAVIRRYPYMTILVFCDEIDKITR